MSRFTRGRLVIVASPFLFLRCGAGDPVAPEAGLLAPCAPGEEPEGALCGVFEVPEDRENPEGRRIALNILVLPAEEQGGEPDPVFILAGGPGQAATDLAPLLRPVLGGVLARRDFVFVDQRGTGASNPLTCDFLEERVGYYDGVPEELTEADWQECLDSLDADPEHYTTPIAMDDLDEVRIALGYGRVNLWGGSYGTRAATVFLRRYPESVRTVILDGVAPVDMRIPLHFAEDGQRALSLLTDACSRDAACAARFPELRDSIERLLARLDRDSPERFNIRNPRTGDWEEIAIRRDLVAGLLRAVLYSPQTAALVPLMVESALDGDFGPLMTFADPATGPELSVGMFLSVVCAEDIPFLTPEAVAEAAEESFLDEAMAMQLEEACAVWPRGELPPGYREPVRSGAPVLILSGELDPVTPPRWGEHAAAALPGARHLVVPGTGHGTLASGCVPRLIEEFLDSADPGALDAACLEDIARPGFWLSGTGPVVPAAERGDDGTDHGGRDSDDRGDDHDDGDGHADDDGDSHGERHDRKDHRDEHREARQAARGGSPAESERPGNPARPPANQVARRSNGHASRLTPGIPPSRAPSAGRLTTLGPQATLPTDRQS